MAITRTINPLHFEDLEPHRFEDLVRQLIYDFRTWNSIEATGRLGSDDGIDIKATERIVQQENIDIEFNGEETTAESDVGVAERYWIIQCKREKSIGPKKIKAIVNDGLSALDTKPYGYILAAACDFSKASRDAFRDEILKYKVEEYHIFGKAEIEDLLFLPKNDHLLFAYFGISLQIKRRSKQTLVRSRLALKRKLIKELGEIRHDGFQMVLIRDPEDDEYPYIKLKNEFVKHPRWRYWKFDSYQPIDHISFVTERYYAYVNWENGQWDVFDSFNALQNFPDLFGLDGNAFDLEGFSSIINAYWNLHIPEENRAWAITLRPISYDRILAIDEIGDLYNEGPHLLVDYKQGDPFESKSYKFLESAQPYSNRILHPENDKRISFFPKKLTDETEKYRESLLEKTKSQ